MAPSGGTRLVTRLVKTRGEVQQQPSAAVAPSGGTRLVTRLVKTRGELQQQLIKTLDELKRRMTALPHAELDDNKLKDFSIVKLSAIDVDEAAPPSSDPLFFRPHPASDEVEFSALVEGLFSE